MATAEKTRVQFDFTPEAYQELNDLQGEVFAATKAETIRYALRSLQWLLSELKSGKRILVEQDGKMQEVIFPFLNRVDRTNVNGHKPVG